MTRSSATQAADEARLAALVDLLRAQPATASEITKAMGAPRATVYAWLKRLGARGVVVVKKRMSVGMGPRTALYALKETK